MSAVKVYLDFQIFDQCSKDSVFKSKIMSKKNSVYYCSTAHLEELYRAIKNAKTESNKKRAQAIKHIIEEICIAGVLNPSLQGIILKSETMSECLQRIKDYDTTQTVQKNAECLKRLHNRSPEFSGDYNRSEKPWEAIWHERHIQSDIQALNDNGLDLEQINSLLADLKGTYGNEKANQQIIQFLQSVCEISFGCYSSIKQTYGKLEYAIEQLARILSRNGYFRDTDIRKTNSGEYDITHMIYGLYCNYFITGDKRLYNRALAIYYYLQAPTKVLWIEDF